MPVKENNLSGVIRIFVIFLAVITLTAAIFQFVNYYGSSVNRIDSFGNNAVRDILVQTAKAYSDKTAANLNMLKAVDEYFTEQKFYETNNFAAQTEYLTNKKAELGAEAVVFIEGDGQYVSADGREGNLELGAGKTALFNEKNVIAQYCRGDFGTEIFIFAVPIQPFTVDERCFSAIGAVYDLEQVRKIIDIEAFNGDAGTYVLDKNGCLAAAGKNKMDDMINLELNLLESYYERGYISEGELNNSLGEIREAKSGDVDIKKEELYYFEYEPVGDTGYVVVCEVSKHAAQLPMSDYKHMITRSFGIMYIFVATSFIIALMCGIAVRTDRIKNKLRLEAERKVNKEKSDFLSAVSHDIRTPMNAIIGMTNIALENTKNVSKMRNCLLKIRYAGEHLYTLINDILDISAMENGKMKLCPEAASVSDIAENLLTFLAPQAASKEQKITVNMKNILCSYIYIDVRRLIQVYINILSNAVKYTPKGGNIEVEFDELESETPGKVTLVYSVKDNGIGMSEDFIKIIFCQFTRAMDVKSRKEEGTGLGMAIAKQIVDEMDGKIDIKSAEGEGSTFTVMIETDMAEPPAADMCGEAAMNLCEEQNPPHTAKTTVPSHIGKTEISPQELNAAGMRVLIAEDNDLNWEVISEQLDGYSIIAERANDGIDCVKKFSESGINHFDVIFMDLRMPRMDGLRAASEIRKLKREDAGTIPIFAMTADVLSADVKLCKEAGMQGHLAKPINIKQVVEVLDKIKKGNF